MTERDTASVKPEQAVSEAAALGAKLARGAELFAKLRDDEVAIATLLRAAEMLGATDPVSSVELSQRALELAPDTHPIGNEADRISSPAGANLLYLDDNFAQRRIQSDGLKNTRATRARPL